MWIQLFQMILEGFCMQRCRWTEVCRANVRVDPGLRRVFHRWEAFLYEKNSSKLVQKNFMNLKTDIRNPEDLHRGNTRCGLSAKFIESVILTRNPSFLPLAFLQAVYEEANLHISLNKIMS